MAHQEGVLFLAYYILLIGLFLPFWESLFGVLAVIFLFEKMGNSASQLPSEFAPTIQTNSGPVRGKVFSYYGKKIDAYLGIPYAQPPVGELRFQKPQPTKPWIEARDCFNFGPRCPQFEDFFQKRTNIVGCDEAGCLTLNVVAPRWKSSEFTNGFPVMVWIHGGGFAIHSSSNYGDATVARNLCTKDILFVSLNYRLGSFGFFSTGDESCSGNMGLWDQAMALKWVKENVAQFGGDPENITIFGQSAGGVSCDLLSLSPYTRDLFQKVIPMAGTAECLFAMRTKEDQASISRQFARSLGWKGKNEDTSDLLRFISSQPSKHLSVNIDNEKFKFEEAGTLLFGPNLDGDFFPAPISVLRKQMPKKDVLTGTTECEGLTLCLLVKQPFNLKGMQNILREIIKRSEYGSETDRLRQEIIEFYTKGTNVNSKKEMSLKHSQLFGDYTISNGAVKYAEKMSELGHNVYFYSFEYFNPDGFGIFKYFLPFRAASHVTELRYVLGKGVVMKFKPSLDDIKMLDQTTTWFSNFAKYGNPNGKDSKGTWEKYSHSNPHRHFRIKLPQSEMMENYQEKRSEFWYDKVLSKNVILPKVN